jgi:transposase
LANIIQFNESTKEQNRARAVLLLDKTTDFGLIESVTGLKKSQCYLIRKTFLQQGIDSIKVKQKIYKSYLTKSELEAILDIVQNQTPDQLGYQQSFWTTVVLADYIESHYSTKFSSKTSYYLIFKKVKFSFHKPQGVYQKHNPELVESWKKNNQAQIQEAWNNPDTVILCEDECIIRSTTTFQKVWLPIADYPKVEITSNRKHTSLYGFLNIKTEEESLFSHEKQNSTVTIENLKKIRDRYPDKNIFLLWDNAGWHTSKPKYRNSLLP